MRPFGSSRLELDSLSRWLLSGTNAQALLTALEESRRGLVTSDRAKRILSAQGYENLISLGASGYGLQPPKRMFDSRTESVGAFGLYLLFGVHPDALTSWMHRLFSLCGMSWFLRSH